MWFKLKSKMSNKYVDKNKLINITSNLLNTHPDLRFFAKRYVEFQDESSSKLALGAQPMLNGTKQDNVMIAAVVMSRINHIFEVADRDFTRNFWKHPHGFASGAAKVMESERLNHVEWQFTYLLSAYILVELYELDSLENAKSLISQNYKALCGEELINPPK